MTLRRLYRLSLAVNLVIIAALAIALIGLTSEQRRLNDIHASSLESISIALSLELSLYEYNRLSNQALLIQSSEFAAERASVEKDILEGIRAAAQAVNSDVERRIVEKAGSAVAEYLKMRTQIESSRQYQARVARMIPYFVTARKWVTTLVEHNRGQARQAALDVARLDSAANIIGGLLFGVALLLAFSAARLSRKMIFRPLDETAAGMGKFSTDASMRLRESGVLEIRAIANAFNQMAEQLEENRIRRASFLAGVAHDLRNPLTAIKSQVEILILRRTPGVPSEALGLIRRQVDRLNGMLQDFLDASRIEAGQLELRFEWTDLRALVADAVALFGPVSQKHTFEVQCPDEPVMAYCDPMRLAQVLNNLVSNAVKYSPGGGKVQVAVSCDPGLARVSVADQGIGIEPDQLQFLYRPFYRAPSIRHEIAGIGLGLSITKKIIEAHGGELAVESRKGEGTRFAFAVPTQARG